MAHARPTSPGPIFNVVIYRAKPGKEQQLLDLVKSHWPALSKTGLCTDTPARVYRSQDGDGKVAFVECFEWKDAKSIDVAHQTPEIMAVWEPMTGVLENLEIHNCERLPMAWER